MIALFLQELEQVFGWLLVASWQASVLALFVLLIQRMLGPLLNPRWRYALWLLVLLRLILPVLPESGFSLFQFTPPPPSVLAHSITEPLFFPAPAPPLSIVHAKISELRHPFSLYSLLAVLWMMGVLFLFILTWIVNRRFTRHVAHSPAITDPELLKLFAEAKAELGIRRSIRLTESSQVQSPSIMGLFYPALLLPIDVQSKFDARELRFIFLHELAHLKRGDVAAQALIALLQILHWFNPILWFSFRRMRIDREPATDALVLSRTGEEEKERYGQMLIKLLEHFNQRHSLSTLVGILEDKDQFKRRFSLIARFTRSAYGWSLLGILAIGILSFACLTQSKTKISSRQKPDQSALLEQPVYSEAASQAFAAGDRASQAGDWDTALSNFNRAIALAPKYVEAYEQRAYAKHQKGDSYGAIADYSQAVALEPNPFTKHLLRGWVKYHLKYDTDGGIAEFDQAIAINPEDVSIYWERGNARLSKKNIEGAIADFSEEIRKYNASVSIDILADAYRWRGYAEYEETFQSVDPNLTRKALDDLQKSIGLNPNDGDYSRFFIWMIQALNPGQMDKATRSLATYLDRQKASSDPWTHQIGLFLIGRSSESDFLKAVEVGAKHMASVRRSEALFYIGMKHVSTGDKAGATAYFQQALATGARHGSESDSAQAWLDAQASVKNNS